MTDAEKLVSTATWASAMAKQFPHAASFYRAIAKKCREEAKWFARQARKAA